MAEATRGARSATYRRIYRVVRRIPRGRVATYGQVADVTGLPGRARQVGYALHALEEPTRVPWHRVINAQGGISRRADPMFVDLQRRLLEAEGIVFDRGGRVSLERFQWRPRTRVEWPSGEGGGRLRPRVPASSAPPLGHSINRPVTT